MIYSAATAAAIYAAAACAHYVPPMPHSGLRLIQLAPDRSVWVPTCALDLECTASERATIADDVWAHLSSARSFGPGFIDITAEYEEHNARVTSGVAVNAADQQLVMAAANSPPTLREMLPNAAAISDATTNPPTRIGQRETVVKLLRELKKENLHEFIKKIVNLFPSRHHNSRDGPNVGAWVAAKFQAIITQSGRNEADVHVALFTGRSSRQPSVIATIVGESPDADIVIIGAHEDSTAMRSAVMPGADDDASGLACVMEVFRVLVQQRFKPRRSIQFMAFAAEEVGLLGSKDIATAYKQQRIKVKGMLQMEMSGYHPARRSGYISVMKDSNYPMGEYLHRLATDYLFNGGSGGGRSGNSTATGVRYRNCGYGCSDHFSWSAAGYPAIAIAEAGPSDSDLNPNIHTSGDTLDKLDMSYLLGFAELGLAYAVELSMAA